MRNTVRQRSSLHIGKGVLGFVALLWCSAPLPLYAETILDVVANSTVPWTRHKEKHGVVIERRAVAGSSFYEYRAATTIPMPPAALIENMWNTVTTKAGPLVKKRQVLSQGPHTLLIYDQINTPVVSDRDYTMRLRAHSLGNDRHEMTFETANAEGPPPDPHFVRIPAIRGRWLVEAEPGQPGSSHVTYQTYSEPGGSVPAFVIHGAQVDQVVRAIEALGARIRSEQQGLAPTPPPVPTPTPPPPPDHAVRPPVT